MSSPKCISSPFLLGNIPIPYGEIGYSTENYHLEINAVTEEDFISRNIDFKSKEPELSVEQMSQEWTEIFEEDASSERMDYGEQYEDWGFEVDEYFDTMSNENHLKSTLSSSNEEPCVIGNTSHQKFDSHITGFSSDAFPKQPLFVFPARSFKPQIDFKKLNIFNEFWVRSRLPLNVTNSTSNSFAIDRSAQTRQCKLTKSAFNNIYVINQVDRKFICCIAEEDHKRHLLLIDQHAAHERICLEKLMRCKFIISFFPSLNHYQFICCFSHFQCTLT